MLGKRSESLLKLVQTHSSCAGVAQTHPHSWCKGRKKKKSLLGTAEKSMASVRSSGTHHDYLHHSLKIPFLRITGNKSIFPLYPIRSNTQNPINECPQIHPSPLPCHSWNSKQCIGSLLQRAVSKLFIVS